MRGNRQASQAIHLRAILPSRESACRLVCVGARVCVPIACARGAADHNNGDRDEGYSRGRGGGDGGGVAIGAVDAVGRLTSPTVGMDGRRYRVSVCAGWWVVLRGMWA